MIHIKDLYISMSINSKTMLIINTLHTKKIDCKNKLFNCNYLWYKSPRSINARCKKKMTLNYYQVKTYFIFRFIGVSYKLI